MALPTIRTALGRHAGPTAVVVVTLLAAGLALRPVEAGAWAEQVRVQPAWRGRSPGPATGAGLSLGLLGGFRALAADLLWLQANAAWERRDGAETRAALARVAWVDPRPVGFWINGARMIGYDLPVWRLDAVGGAGAVPRTVVEHVFADHARAAIAHLESAFAAHPDEPLLHIEIANLQLNRLGDLAAATERYRRAALQPTAPYYAARLHAELLCRQGREQAAHAWLVALHPRLPSEAQNPYAMADTVLARIRQLEERLALPAAERYQPGRE